MRVNYEVENGKIFKRDKSSLEYYEWIAGAIDQYQAWITNLGFTPLATDIRYERDSGEIVFIQDYIEDLGILDYENTYNKLLSAEYDYYGLDANPDNFILHENNIVFIDYHPLLIKDSPFTKSQFSYGWDLITKRYFNTNGSILLFLNRLFKKYPDIAYELASKWVAGVDLSDNTLSKRDLDRFSYALSMHRSGEFDVELYSRYYKETKDIFN